MKKKKPSANSSLFKKIWYFLWYEDSILSWISLVAVAFITIKFGLFPFLGLIFGTDYPIVAVVSGSMDHDIVNGEVCGQFPTPYKNNFGGFWSTCGSWYLRNNISRQDFLNFPMHNGFSKGDIIILRGKKPEDINIGDVIVFEALDTSRKPDPIIHRVVLKGKENTYFFQTKGDHNGDVWSDKVIYEEKIDESRILGVAWVKLPYLGFVKIKFIELIEFFGG
jgi:signal peptidase I